MRRRAGAVRGAAAARAAAVALAGLGIAPAAGAATAFTAYEGTNFALDVGPDGRAVLDAQGRLWSLAPEGGAAVPITDGLGDDRLPRWSPDGAWIAFQSFRNGSWDIWLVRPDGRDARALTTAPGDEREPAWLPDGTAVAYAGEGEDGYDVWRAPLDGGAPSRLTDSPGDEYAPAFSPAGALAYVAERGGKPALWIAETGVAPRLVAGGDRGRLSAARFSPDGESIAFVAPEEELGFPGMARERVLVAELAGGAVRAVSPAGADAFPFAPAWLPGGALAWGGDGGIRVTDAAGATRAWPFTLRFELEPTRRAGQRRLAREGRRAVGIVEPVLAPDGQSVVFTALGDLWRRRADGALERLTQDAFVERDPAFSPDGATLAYAGDRGGTMQVRARDLASGADRALTDVAGGVRYPVFSPDGATLAFQQPGPRGDQDFGVRLLDLASGKVRALKTPPLWPGRMSFTGDGRHLALAVLAAPSRRAREGVNRIGLVALADGAWRALPVPGALPPDTGPVIAPDGAQAAVAIDGALNVLPLAPDGAPAGAPRELVAALAEYPSWSGDSRSVLFLGLDGLRRVDAAGGRARRLPVALPRVRAPDDGPLLVHAGRLWDGTGEGWRRDVDVLVEDGRIRSVRAHAPHPAGLRVIDAAGEAVLPGLIENHAHHQAHDGEWVGRAWLAFGVTTVVEPGGLPLESRELAESWDSGARPGPRLLFAGPQLDGARRYFPFAAHVTTARRLDWELERARRLDYALLKTYTRMPPARQREVIARGARLGLVASSHEVFPALAMGGGRVEHLRGTSRAGFSSKQSDLLRTYADVVGLVATPGAAVSPTLVVSGGFFSWWLAHPELAANRQLVALYPVAYRNGLAGFAQLVGRRRALLEEGVGNARAATLALHRAGARIVAGTDAPIFPYGLSLVGELANYVAAGLAPVEALRTATSASADALGLGGELGRVAPGRRADLLVVAGDPLARVEDLLAVRGVLRGGRWHEAGDLLAARESP